MGNANEETRITANYRITYCVLLLLGVEFLGIHGDWLYQEALLRGP
jgi:hypothetical protein